MNYQYSRKRKLALGVLSAVATLGLVAGCSAVATDPVEGPSTESFDGDVLRVAIYGAAFEEFALASVVPEFEKRTGATVVFTVGSPSDYIPAVIAAGGANPPYDVLYLDDQTQAQMSELGLLAESDSKRLDEISGNEIFETQWPATDPGMALWYIGIAYNAEKLAEAGIPDPTSWEDLWDPRLAGRVDLPNINTGMGIPTVSAAAAVSGADETDLSAGIAKLNEIQTNAVYQSSSQMQNDFANENIWMASSADGRAGIMRQQGLPVKFVVPEIPGTDKSGYMQRVTVDLVKGSPNLELARIYQELVHEPEQQKALALATTYSPISVAVVEELIAEDPELFGGQWPAHTEWDNLAGIDWQKVLPKYQDVVSEFQQTIN